MNSIWKNIKVLLILPVILLIAFVLIHLMALFGIFVAAAYPIWAVFFPKQAFCFGCRYTKPGSKCVLCNEKVEHEYHPKNARSIILNSFVILSLTVLSLGVVFLENQVIDSTGILQAGKTVSFVIPDRSQYRTNEIFPMKIQITGINTAINVVQADITFDPDILEVIEVSTVNSFASIFVQKDVNNKLGYLRLTGGIPSPGYNKSEGEFGTVYFKTKTAGLVTVSFLPTSLVLADDGRGTNVLRDFPTTSYVIRPEAITLEEEINQREVFEKDVLGATIEEDLSICRIDLDPKAVDSVLGTYTSENEKVLDTDIEVENFFSKAWYFIINMLHYISEFILNIYAKILGGMFTN